VEILITFKKWTKLSEKRVIHTLNFEGNGESGTKEFEIGVARENYLENMMKKIQLSNYEENIEDKKKDRLSLEIGIEVTKLPSYLNPNFSSLKTPVMSKVNTGLSPKRTISDQFFFPGSASKNSTASIYNSGKNSRFNSPTKNSRLNSPSNK
jgi:hypothetical protein